MIQRSSTLPFFLKHALPLFFIAALLCILSYFFLDIPLAFYFLQPSTLYPLPLATVLTTLIDPCYHYILWPALFLIAKKAKAPPLFVRFCFLLMLAIPLANLFSEAIKMTTGRARPELFFSQHVFAFTFFKWKNLYKSFPSGHSCTAGAIAASLSLYIPRKALLFFALAVVFAFSRVVLELHYLSDVIAGLTVGYGAVGILYAFRAHKIGN